jgi:lysophospholipase L1-like esterase
MRRILLIALVGVILSSPAFAQVYHFKIAIIGSSTAVGTGATPIDSSWVNLLNDYLKGLHEIDTIINRAAGGTITASGASNKKDTGIVWVLANDNPDLVIISYASNDAAGDIAPDSTMKNLRFMYNLVTDLGKVCWVTTPHPRDSLSPASNHAQAYVRDSTYAQFPGFSIDFWDCLVASDGFDIAHQYDYDGVHVNNAGHQQLFQQVKAANILSTLIPLALVVDSFTAVPQSADVLLNWVSAPEGSVRFVVQRSSDGDNFTGVGQQTADANIPGTRYSWTDPAPLPGRNYYRLQTTADGNATYSPIVSVQWKGADWGIGDIYLPQGGSQLTATVQSSKSRNITLGVFDAMGRQISSQAGYAEAPETRFTISVAMLAQGQYFLRVISTDGKVSAKAFLKW